MKISFLEWIVMYNTKRLQTLILIVLPLFGASFILGCGNESASVNQKQVVGKKISSPKPMATQKNGPKEAEKPSVKVAESKKVSAKVPVAKKEITTPPISKSVPQKAAVSKDPVDADKGVTSHLEGSKPIMLASLYNPIGRTDPFESPLLKKPVKRKKKKRRIPQTPLEKIDISQLKLTGVINVSEGRKALVEEASGKGYVVNKGTYIGIHGGQISEITKSSILVDEEVEDIYGNPELKQRELKLLKPLED